MRWLVLLGAAGCAGDPPGPVEPLSFAQGAAPTTTTCLATANVAVTGTVPARFLGASATFRDVDGAPVGAGTVGPLGGGGADLTLQITWAPASGILRGDLEIDGESVPVTVRVDVLGPQSPAIQAFGFDDGAGGLRDPAELDALAASGPWDGGVDVAGIGALIGAASDPRGLAGAPTTLAFEVCAEDGADCQPLPSAPGTGWGDVSAFADLAPLAERTCDALPERPRALLRVRATNACGSVREDLVLRVVHDDCDGDGVLAASDCNELAPGLQAEGDVSADGVGVPDLASALGAVEVLLCGGEHAGGLGIAGNTLVRSTFGPAVVHAPGTGATLRIEEGAHVVLEGLDVRAGTGSPVDAGDPTGPLAGGAVHAGLAGSLVLRHVDLHGADVDRGGALWGPVNGALDVFGGVWTGGSAGSGGVAHLGGGRLEGVEIVGGTASGAGGGLYASGDLTLIDVLLRDHTAGEGGGVAADGELYASGVTFLRTQASTRGGGILAFGAVDLRPSIVSLATTRFEDVQAGASGGALWATDVNSVLVDVVGASAPEGGAFRVDGPWSDANSTLLEVTATDGAAAWVRTGPVSIAGADWQGAADVPASGLHVASGPVVLQTSVLTGFVCGATVAGGTLTVGPTTTGANDADVCGPGAVWTAPFAAVTCDPAGCAP